MFYLFTGAQGLAVGPDASLLLSSLFSSAADSWRQPSNWKKSAVEETASRWELLLQQLPHLSGASATPANSAGRLDLVTNTHPEPETETETVVTKPTPKYHRGSYEEPPFDVDAVELMFNLDADETEVSRRWLPLFVTFFGFLV